MFSENSYQTVVNVL